MRILKLLSFLFLFPIITQAQIIKLDPDYGEWGLYKFDYGTEVYSKKQSISTSDNGLLICGTRLTNSDAYYKPTLTKINSDAQPDNAFGDGGTYTLLNGDENAIAKTAFELADGSYIIGADFATNVNPYGALFKLDSNGNFIDSFGDQGFVTIDMPQLNFINSLFIDPEENIWVSGVYFTGSTTPYYGTFLAKYSAEGILDESFAMDGFFTLEDPTYSTITELEYITTDEKLVLHGFQYFTEPEYKSRPVVFQLESNGVFDNTFGNNGIKLILEEMEFESLYFGGMEFDEMGGIVAAGTIEFDDGSEKNILARFYPDYTPNNYFGDNGVLILDEYADPKTEISTLFLDENRINIFGTISSGIPFPDRAFIQILDFDGAPNLEQGPFGVREFELGIFNYTAFIKGQNGKFHLVVRQFNDDNLQEVLVCRFREEGFTSATIEQQNALQINCFPNPTSGEIYLDFETTIAGEMEFQVFDLSGNKVSQLPIQIVQSGSNRIQLDIPTWLPAGQYILYGISKTDHFISKFIFQTKK